VPVLLFWLLRLLYAYQQALYIACKSEYSKRVNVPFFYCADAVINEKQQ
jgi:hypothetical protein